MECKRIIGFWEAGVQTVFQHRQSALPGFLGGLQDHHQCSCPFIFARHQLPGRSHPTGHMRVMAASVHDISVIALTGLGLGGRCEGKPGFLLQRQAIHVGTNQDRRSVAIFHHRNHAGPTDFFGNGKAQAPRFGSQFRSGANFLAAEFRVGVQVAINFHQRWQVSRNRIRQAVGLCGRYHQHRRSRQQGQFRKIPHHHPQFLFCNSVKRLINPILGACQVKNHFAGVSSMTSTLLS